MTTIDRQLEVYAAFDARIRESLRRLINEDLIAEHASQPLGPHSDALTRVVNYFRRAPQAGKYIIVAEEPWQRYRIARLTGVRGAPPQMIDDVAHASEEAAMHAVFLLRVRDLMED